MRLLRFAVPCAGTLSLLASSSLFAAAEAHPNHHWQNRRAALEEMPVVRDYPDGYGTAAQLPVRRAPLRRVARSGQVLDPQAAQRRCKSVADRWPGWRWQAYRLRDDDALGRFR